MAVVVKELKEIKKKFGDDRRSHIIEGGKEVDIASVEKELKQIDDFVVAYTTNKAFKKMTERNFKSSDKKVKDNSTDFVKIKCNARSDQTLLAFTNLGNVCKIDMEIAPECRFRDKGFKFTDVVKEAQRNEYPVAFFAINENEVPDGYLLFYTKNGLIKKTEWKEYTLIKPYYQAIKLKDDDVLVGVEQDLPETTIAFVTSSGIVLNAVKDSIPVQGRVAGGVKGINLSKGDEIVFVSQVDEEGEFVIITDTGFYKKVLSAEIEPLERARKGVKICELGRVNKIIFANYVKEPYDIAVVDNFGVAFGVNTEELSIENRTTKGKTLKNENKKRKPEKAFRIF
jgi:DNA gyrase/topoisomerase IV subunit A